MLVDDCDTVCWKTSGLVMSVLRPWTIESTQPIKLWHITVLDCYLLFMTWFGKPEVYHPKSLVAQLQVCSVFFWWASHRKGCGAYYPPKYLLVILYISERCGLAEPSKIEKIQDIYTKALECYCNAKVKTGNRRFAKLIMKMIDLRTLNAIHSEMCLSLKIKTGNFPGILLEYFNIG